jgi:outer membrane protein assembly factor BamB
MEPLAATDLGAVGPYRLQARLGAGGMGQVFLGFSPAGRAVAVKVIYPQLAADPEFVERFTREAVAARAVSGVHTAPVVAAGPGDHPPWLATAFVAGPSLTEAVAVAGPLAAAAVWRLAAGLVEALADIHACGLVHRDLKPANVLLAIDGPRVIDFGISRALEGAALTTTGLAVGTPSFMSPEQASGGQAGPASDVFSFGSLVVFASTGATPFGGGPTASLLYRVVHDKPVLDGVPDGGLRDLAEACLAKDPARRPTLPRLMETILAAAPPMPTSLDSFWPEPVDRLIRTHQARLSAEFGRGRAGPPGLAGAEEQQAPGRVAIMADMRTATVGARVLARPDVDAGHHRRPGLGGDPTRRGVLAGLAGVAAAALAVTGWELASGSAGHRAQASQVSGPVSREAAKRKDGSGKPAHSAPRPAAGSEVWSSGTGSGAFTRPVVAGSLVYFPGQTGNAKEGGSLYALRTRDGAAAWSSGAGGGLSTEPAVTSQVICFAGNDDRLYALRADDGATLWDSSSGGGPATQPATVGGVIYFGGNDDRLYALRATDGSQIWAAPTSSGLFTAPVIGSGVVYAGGNDDRLYAVRTDDGTQLWTAPASDGFIALPVAGTGVVYFGENNFRLYAVRASDGSQLWSFAAGGKALTLPAVAGGVIYFGADNGQVHALNAADGTPVWQTAVGGDVATYPAVAGGVVYVGGTDGRLYALRAGDGTQIWSTDAGQGPATDLAVAGGVIYFGGNNARLYALNV